MCATEVCFSPDTFEHFFFPQRRETVVHVVLFHVCLSWWATHSLEMSHWWLQVPQNILHVLTYGWKGPCVREHIQGRHIWETQTDSLPRTVGRGPDDFPELSRTFRDMTSFQIPEQWIFTSLGGIGIYYKPLWKYDINPEVLTMSIMSQSDLTNWNGYVL